MGQSALLRGPDLLLDFQVQSHKPLPRKGVLGSSVGEDEEERKEEGSASEDASASPMVWGTMSKFFMLLVHDFQTPWAGCSYNNVLQQ